MKKFLSLFIFLFISTSLFGQTNTGTQYAAPQYRSIEIDGYAARVNDRIITRGEVVEALTPLMPELYRTYQGAVLQEELEKAFDKVREQLVERALIMEAYKAKGGQLPDQYVNDEIRRVINDRFKGDEAGFEQWLTMQKKTRAEFMETIREQLVVGYLMNEEVGSRARVTPEQVRKAYESNKESYFIPEKVKYSVIVLNRGASAEDQAVKRAEAESIRAQLVEGGDFGETARAVSEGSRAAEGGAFPWMQPKDVRPELQEILKTLPAGEISEIITTDTELYLVKVEARRQAGCKNFDEVRQTIKADLNAKERERLKARWISRLKENNYVVIYD